LRAKAVSLVAALVALALVTAGPAAAETLIEQAPGPSGIALPSDEGPQPTRAYDDVVVHAAPYWNLEAIRVFGVGKSEHPTTFNLKVLWGGGGAFPGDLANHEVFSERVTVAGGPNYVIPIEGGLRLGHPHEWGPGQYWFSVQATNPGGEDEWAWLTGPDTAGNAPAVLNGYQPNVEGAEPGLAFQLLGTATQIIKAASSGPGTIVSSPPGISCPGKCEAEFPRGAAVTFTPQVTSASDKFTEWGYRRPAFWEPEESLFSYPLPSPCGGTGGCSLTLNEDVKVGAVFEPIDEATILRVVRDKRTGRGKLLVWAPGDGLLNLNSVGVKAYFPHEVSTGTASIPLIPTKKTAKTLLKKGRATVSVEVDFHANNGPSTGTTNLSLTLVRKATSAHRRRGKAHRRAARHPAAR
jgi:hypothetical protein